MDLAVESGTIHALVEEDQAGKVTLMRILCGAIHPTAGTYQVNGAACAFRNSAEAIAEQDGMVSQHYSIILTLLPLTKT